MMKLLASFLILVLIAGCGYVPASKQARKIVGNNLYVEVIVPLEDPINAVIIKDAMRKSVVTRFHSSLVDKSKAQTELLVEMSNIAFQPLQYDQSGYIIVYRAIINIVVTRLHADKKELYLSKGNFDFTIEPNAVITDTQRLEAISKASLKALDSFVAQVGAKGSRL